MTRRTARVALNSAFALLVLCTFGTALAKDGRAPGSPHPTSPHVLASDTPGSWSPEAGYRFLNDEPGDLRVEWAPGTENPDHPNTVAADDEGEWRPAPGYRFVNQDPGDLRVEWVPGKKHPVHPSVIASDRANRWRPAPGFKWVTDEPGDFRVLWIPGEAHPEHRHVVAGRKPNSWEPEQGYVWITPGSSDFRVRRSVGAEPDATPPATSGKDQRVALVVGNDDYDDPADELPNCVNDARRMGDLLESLGFDVECACDVDEEQLDEAVDRFIARLDRGAAGWFFFSGHGMQIDGVNYLLPTDFSATSRAQARNRALSADYVQQSMEEKGARLIIMVLDACRTNFASGKGAGSATLASMSGGEGTLIAFATAPGRTASANPDETLSLFTRHLLDVMPTPGLGIEEVFRETRKRVHRASGGEQVPFLTTGIVEDFCLVPKE